MFRLAICFVLSVGGCLTAAAQEPQSGAAPTLTEAPVNPDETAIRSAIDSYNTAFNQGDAKGVAAHFSDHGSFDTPSGKSLQGREQIETAFAEFFEKTKGASIEVFDVQVSFVSPSVAIETGTARVAMPEQDPADSQYEAVHIKTADGWKIDSVREEDAPVPPPTHYEQLKQLEWMVGTWVDEDENAVIETTCKWTKNFNFMTRSFKVYVEDRVDFEGTQIIGWDPELQKIRSWVFDSDGGFGVGLWTGDGKHWSVKSLMILADGKRATATQIFEYIDDNTFEFQSIGRQVDGALLPNIDPVKIVRASE